MEEKDYKKLYEDVVTLAKDGLKDGLYLSQSAKDVTEFLFPQLKETEDEKVKRELTRFLINFNNGYCSKPSETEIDSWIKWIDKKFEQNPVPKFKVGDWITNGGLLVGQVTSFDGEYYHYMCEGIEQPLHISNAYNWHLWTIEDAKDGDVLAEHETIVLFKKIEDQNIRCYCTYHYLGFNPTFYVGTLQNKNPYCPATKEQHDILFQKMKEEGYEWDVEKKELNKIEKQSEQIHAEWSEKDEENLNWVINVWNRLRKGGDAQTTPNQMEMLENWLTSIKDRVQPQPKQDWSEEGSERLLRIHQFIWANRKGDTDEIFQQEQDADWLMSIIPQPNQYDKGFENGYDKCLEDIKKYVKEVINHEREEWGPFNVDIGLYNILGHIVKIEEEE